MLLPDHKDREGNWVRSWGISYKTVCTVSGRKWGDMWKRCTPGSREQRINPNYEGCTVAFKDFKDFCEWHMCQVGYGEFELDKDLLVPGNQAYGTKTCILLPKIINSTLSANRRGEKRGLPTGVTVRDGKYRATFDWPEHMHVNRPKSLGTFIEVEQAHQAYISAKRQALHLLAEEYKDRLDPRAYEALMNR